MKILMTADLHYQEHWCRWLLNRAADYDLICIGGDLLELAGYAPVYEGLVALGREPKITTDGVAQVVNDLIVTTVRIIVRESESRF